MTIDTHWFGTSRSPPPQSPTPYQLIICTYTYLYLYAIKDNSAIQLFYVTLTLHLHKKSVLLLLLLLFAGVYVTRLPVRYILNILSCLQFASVTACPLFENVTTDIHDSSSAQKY